VGERRVQREGAWERLRDCETWRGFENAGFLPRTDWKVFNFLNE